MVKIAFGSIGDSLSVGSLKAYLAEFIATLLFVFAGVGSAIAFNKLTSGAALDPAGLVAIAVAHAFALFVGVSMAANISGGHLNPAVTLGLAVGGNITILTGLFYWVAQLLGSTVACLLLKYVTNGLAVPTHGVAAGMSGAEGVVMEIVITFALVYTVYATAADPKKGSLGTIAPIAIGFIVGANILAAGPFSGGSMNPARSFGPAVVAGDFSQNWIYWVGPLIGGGLAGFIYGDVFIGCHTPLPTSINPSAFRHYLVIPKQHIPTVKNLQRSSDDFSLVSHMLDVGKSLLDRDAPQSKHYRFGFHQPPFNSVDHLHLHCFALPYTPSWRFMKYLSLGPLGGFIEVEKLLERIKPPIIHPSSM